MNRTSSRSKAQVTVARQRRIQSDTDQRDARQPSSPPKKKAVQAAPRKEPENPLPAQHLENRDANPSSIPLRVSKRRTIAAAANSKIALH